MKVYIPADLQRIVRSRFSDRCAYCQSREELCVAIFEFEHITPRSTGGKTEFENLCIACPTCNRYKSDSIAATDPITHDNVPLFHPHRDDWSEHFAWSDDTTLIIGLSPTGRATISALRMNRMQMIRVRRMWHVMGEHPPHTE